MSEHTTLFLHFQAGEGLPKVGESLLTHSTMTGMVYRVVVRVIKAVETLEDGRIRMTVQADRDVWG